MLVFAGMGRDLLHLGRRDIFGINPANAPTLSMHFEHYLRRTLAPNAEKAL